MSQKVQRFPNDTIKAKLAWLEENHAFNLLSSEEWSSVCASLLSLRESRFGCEDALTAVTSALGREHLSDVLEQRVTRIQFCWLLACLLPSGNVLTAAKAVVCPVPYARSR